MAWTKTQPFAGEIIRGVHVAEMMQAIHDRFAYVSDSVDPTWYKYTNADPPVKTSVGTYVDSSELDGSVVHDEQITDMRTNIITLATTAHSKNTNDDFFAGQFVNPADNSEWSSESDFLTDAIGSSSWTSIGTIIKGVHFDEIQKAINKLTRVRFRFFIVAPDGGDVGLERNDTDSSSRGSDTAFSAADSNSATAIALSEAGHYISDNENNSNNTYAILQAFFMQSTSSVNDGGRFSSYDSAYFWVTDTQYEAGYDGDLAMSIDSWTCNIYTISDPGSLTDADWDTSGTSRATFTARAFNGYGTQTRDQQSSDISGWLSSSADTYLTMRHNSDGDIFNAYTLGNQEVDLAGSVVTNISPGAPEFPYCIEAFVNATFSPA